MLLTSNQPKNLLPNLIKDHESTREAAKKSSGSVSGDASAEEDAILEELAMISSQRNNAEVAAAVNLATIATLETEAEELEEERDAFEDMPSPLSLPASGSVHRPIPLLHSAAPRGAGHHQHPRLQALQASSSMPPSPSSGQSSLPASTGSSTSGSMDHQDAASNINSNKQGMSRSISDSTLRRAALHLNLNQSVLPSFTSLQQFKVLTQSS